jgi:hypothetical protein
VIRAPRSREFGLRGRGGLLLALAFLASAATAATAPSGRTVTRAVAEYRLLEERLAAFVIRGDRPDLETVVAADFTLLAPALPDPLSRSEWIERAIAEAPLDAAIYELNVIEQGDVDLVSFLVRTARRPAGRRVPAAMYIVDVWERATHRLVRRYAIPLPRAPQPQVPTRRE